MSGGQGTRISEISKGKPKSLILIDGIPVVQMQLKD